MCAPTEGNWSLDQPFEAWATPAFQVDCERSQTTYTVAGPGQFRDRAQTDKVELKRRRAPSPVLNFRSGVDVELRISKSWHPKAKGSFPNAPHPIPSRGQPSVALGLPSNAAGCFPERRRSEKNLPGRIRRRRGAQKPRRVARRAFWRLTAASGRTQSDRDARRRVSNDAERLGGSPAPPGRTPSVRMARRPLG